MTQWYISVALIATAIKALLIPSYRSTDFEVHRNWLAITHSLPISKWYYEATSIWTLDYPPLFAWFEWCLSQVAKWVDPQMLVVENLEYASRATVLFQRCSVMATDGLLIWAAYKLARSRAVVGGSSSAEARGRLLFLLLVFNAGLLIVDHVHFQYNGVMMGLLLLSVHYLACGRDLIGGALFAVLVNMKHLFAYAGPVYFVYILRHYCMAVAPAASPAAAAAVAGAAADGDGGAAGGEGSRSGALGRRGGATATGGSSRRSGAAAAAGRFLIIGAVVAAVCGVSLGPFIAMGQLPQLLARMFPFGRGLCHAYWAANAWALYSAADKVLAAALPRLLPGLVSVQAGQANMAGGIVGVSRFAVLPQIEPRATMIAVLLCLLPCLASLWRRPQPGRVAAAVAYSFLTGFMWGYHVHEKAIIVALLPLAIPAVSNPAAAADFLLLAAAGHYGLFPLLYGPEEYLVKLLLTVSYSVLAAWGLSAVHGSSGSSKGGASKGFRLGPPAQLYLYGFVALELYCSWVHPQLLGARLPFVPLLLTSVYCALGVCWVWLRMAGSYCASALGRCSGGLGAVY